MDFKLPVYVRCPTCGVKDAHCNAGICKDGSRTILVTREEMNALLSGRATLEVRGDSCWVVACPSW
jgi:hypothetical protein